MYQYQDDGFSECSKRRLIGGVSTSWSEYRILHSNENNKPSHQTYRLLAASLPRTSFPAGIWKLFNFLQIKHQKLTEKKNRHSFVMLVKHFNQEIHHINISSFLKVRKQTSYLNLNDRWIIKNKLLFIEL